MNDIRKAGSHLWVRWMEMWNGRADLALELVAARFVLHLPLPPLIDPTTVVDPASVARWVRDHRAKFERLTFQYQAGPYVDVAAGVVAGPWSAEVSVAGASRVVCGMDTIAFREGKATEYWTLAKDVDTIGDWNRASSI